MPIVANFVTGNSGSGIPLEAVNNVSIFAASQKLYLQWTDPEDVSISGIAVAEWSGTQVVRKAGSVPTSRRDGTLVLDSTVKNAYALNYFCDSGLVNGTTYYYRFFPYTTTHTYTDDAQEYEGTPYFIAPENATNISATVGSRRILLRWTDPNDIVSHDIVISAWSGTKVVYKTDGYPTNPDDGTLVINSKTKNAYKNTDLVINGLENNVTYYIALFPYSTDGCVNTSDANRASATPAYNIITTDPSQNGTLVYSGST